MLDFRLSRHLGWLFVLAVLIPSTVLAVLSVRSIRREKAYIEKSLETTLLAEIGHVVSLVETELDAVWEELGETTPVETKSDPKAVLVPWEAENELVETAFMLTDDFEILWPNSSGDLTNEQLAFLAANGSFLTGRISVPVYQNIAAGYEDEIVSPFTPQMGNSVQTAIQRIEEDPTVRKKAFDRAEAKGQITFPRAVSPSNLELSADQAQSFQRSIFVAVERTFREITQDENEGVGLPPGHGSGRCVLR